MLRRRAVDDDHRGMVAEMSAEDLDRLCREAMARIIESINRSAGQHLRAMRKIWNKK
jgi:hypothetical protein